MVNTELNRGVGYSKRFGAILPVNPTPTMEEIHFHRGAWENVVILTLKPKDSDEKIHLPLNPQTTLKDLEYILDEVGYY